jgi:GNAT superfamily N-acetyltransferase
VAGMAIQDQNTITIANPQLVLRRAGPDDFDTIQAMSAALYAADGMDISERSQTGLTALLHDPTFGIVFLACRPEADTSPSPEEHSVVGQIILCFGYSVELGGRDLLVEELFVKPAHRGKGYGAAILTAAEQWAREAGFASVFLEVLAGNTAEALYRKHGYGARDSIYLSKSLLPDA